MAKNNKVKAQTSKKSWWEQVLNGEKYTIRQVSYFFLIIGTFLYINTVGNQYSMDDSLVTQGNQSVMKGLRGIPELLTSTYIYDENKIKGEYRPVTQITYAIEYELFGENPAFSHFMNALLYGIVCLLIYVLFNSVFDKRYHIYILIGTLIFTLHPIHTEVVASLKNRENILGALFGLLASIQALKYIDNKKASNLIYTFVFLLLAIGAKIDSIFFAGVFILLSIYRNTGIKKIFVFFGFTLIILAVFVIYKEFYINPDGFRITEFYETPLVGDDRTFSNTILLALYSLWYYIKLLLFPYPLRFYYGTGLINLPTWANVFVWLSLVIHSVMLYFGIRGVAKKEFYGFIILWYLGSVFLFAQIIEPVTGIIAERHIFISSIGFSMLLAYFLIRAYHWLVSKDKSYGNVLKTTGLIVLFIAMLMVLKRNKDWYDANSLYTADAPKLEESIFFHFEYANQFARNTGNDPADTVKYAGNLKRSVEEYRKVLKHVPNHTTSWYNMGVSYLRYGKWEEGRESFMKARDIDSNWRAVNQLIGITNLYLKDTTSAIIYFNKELTKTPNNGSALNLLYEIYKAKEDWKPLIDIGIKLEKRGLKTERLYKTLANAYHFYGDDDKAIYYRRKVEMGEVSGAEKNEW